MENHLDFVQTQKTITRVCIIYFEVVEEQIAELHTKLFHCVIGPWCVIGRWMPVYLYGYWSWDFHQASEYFHRTFQTELLPHTSQLWIRSSTGLLCADPMDYTNGKAGHMSHAQPDVVDAVYVMIDISSAQRALLMTTGQG
ncbi:hypothetical protein K438DRAFT_1764172 [Mycena galopus ATCC 62051]|nr:hypothetical protein K438DRAFT_1764172 [Mycena galopus ATCC 62051]